MKDPLIRKHTACSQQKTTKIMKWVLLFLREFSEVNVWLLYWLKKRIQAFKTKCLKKLLCISYLVHKTNNWVGRKINCLVGPQEPLLATIKRWKLAWFRHVTRHNSLSKTICQGTFEGGQHRGQQRKCWTDIKEWTSLPLPELLSMAACRRNWRRISAKSSVMSPWQPNRSRVWTKQLMYLVVDDVIT